MFGKLLTAAVFAATTLAPTARAACDRWDIEIYEGDVCDARGELANNIYIGVEPLGCTSTSGFSVPLNSMSVQGDDDWTVNVYDNDDCTCSNPFLCPAQWKPKDDGSTECHDWSSYSSFEVVIGQIGGCA